MSMTIAPESDRTPKAETFRDYRGKLWRIVEAQHRISTNRLASGGDDQALLEQLVEEVKPVQPVAARHLHYLLATPFRYGHKSSSRFRKAGEKPGIFYAAETVATALAETAYWRLRFYSRSPGFQPPASIVEHTAISVTVAIERLLDLCAPPYDAAKALWMDPGDYSACQAFAAEARTIGTQAIRYASVRDPEHRANVALFDPAVFQGPVPKNAQTWHFRFERGEMTAYAAFPSRERFAFRNEDFGL
ncbi:RES family NAD+ phosphorylase [Sphingopyxis indica]|uniref:RES domain-containing protein n=1 Tax=Sphingopyxis indica TaxID=436663 RepID=A0A239FT50_9SPHN|nr:RES family NAD+ phosphorylase [Sphingopyxis indica]SNS59748.1 RES domain-containing protein [Sphingopyxis indica]